MEKSIAYFLYQKEGDLMYNFNYYTPTKVVFGKNTEDKCGELVKEQGCKKVMIHYGSGSVKRTGLLDKVKASLDEAKINYIELGGAVPNPRLSLVYEGIELAKKEGVDFILAVGGGSAIDSAKAIGYGVANEGDVWDFYDKKRQATGCLPIGVVLTIAATGSEMSNSCVISDRENNFKGGFNHYTNYPTFALLDPTLTYSVSPFQTACGLVDILSHSFERYFCTSQKFELSDYLALSVIKQIIELSPTVMNNPNDYEARRAMMLCGSFSHNGWTGFGKTTKMHCHGIEHTLSGRHPEIAHGEGLRFLLAEFIKVNYDLLKDKIAKFGKFVFDENDPSMVYNRLEKYFSTLPLRHSMRECGISESEENELLLRLKLN